MKVCSRAVRGPDGVDSGGDFGGGEEVDVVFGEVDAGFEGGDEGYELVLDWGDLAGEGAAELLGGDAGLVEGAGFDEVANCFCLSEIEAAGEEGSLGEFAGFGEARSAGDALAEEVVEEDGGAVGGDFDDVFGGVGGGGGEVGDYGFVEVSPSESMISAKRAWAGARGWRRRRRGSAMVRAGAGEADDADAAAAGWGGDGDDGVFELRHGSSAGFSYGNGRKKCWRGGVVFLRGVLRKVVCRTWFFDGEIVVDCVVKRGEKTPRFRGALKMSPF